MRRGRWTGATLGALVLLGPWLGPWRPARAEVAAPPATAAPTVTAVELVSPHRLPEERVRAVIGSLVGGPRLRGLVRDSVERLWSLGVFERVRVEEVEEPGGVRLRYHLARRPYVQSLEFRGDLGLPRVDLTAAVGLPIGGGAEPARLERARRDLVALYEREGFRRARVSVTAAVDAATNGRRVTFEIDAGERARVGRIDVRGLARVSADDVRKAFGLREGDRFREPAVREGVTAAQERLRTDGFFEARVTAAPPVWDPATNTVALALTVAEGPRVRVEFRGNRAVKDAVLAERLTFAATGAVDEAELRASVRQVEAAYRERGHAFVAAGGTIVREDGDVVVRISVEEGPRVAVESVDFPGASAVPPARLARAVETRPSRLPRRGLLVEETLESDVLALTSLLRAEGFPDARVGPPRVTYDPTRTRARVVIPIEEGRRLKVGQVAVTGQRVLSAAELLDGVALKRDGPWSEAATEETRRLLQRRYARRGYHAARIEPETARRDDAVDVTFRIEEGPQTRIGRVLVRGLTATREDVVRRELPFHAGDPLNPEDLVEAQRRLGRLGLFELVQVDPLRPPPEPFADVIVTVREGKPWHADVGGGYSDFEGVRGFVEVGHDNLFGTARGLAVRLRISERGDREDVLYREPWVLGTRWLFEANPFRERRQEIGFEFERLGLTLGIQRDLYPEVISGLRGAIAYSIARVDRFDVDPTLAAADVVPGKDLVATVTPELTLDRRDRVLDPRRGSFSLASVRIGGLFAGGDVDFVKGRLETAWFFDWLPPTVLAVAGRLGLAAPFGTTAALPIEERFFAGGATTVRGYRERRLGPLDAAGNPTGGNAQLIVNVEWRFPVWRWLSGAVFFDSGAVTAEIEDLEPRQLKSGAGGGLRLVTPVGPVRLDAGYPLDRVPNQAQKVRYYFSVGYPF